MATYTAKTLNEIALLFDRNRESAERSARITAITQAQKNQALGEAAAYTRAAEILRDTLMIDDDQASSDINPDLDWNLERKALEQIARCLHSAVVLMTLPPFKRDNATVNPDGTLTINRNHKEQAS